MIGMETRELADDQLTALTQLEELLDDLANDREVYDYQVREGVEAVETAQEHAVEMLDSASMSKTGDYTETADEHSLAGGGDLEYSIRGRENAVRHLETEIRAAVNRWSSRYFQAGDASDRRRPPLVTRDRKHPAIREAVAEANQRPSWVNRDAGDMVYVVEDAYYPDDYSHNVDLTGIDVSDRAHAFMHLQGALAKRGFVVNSIRSAATGRLTKLHVVRLRWIDEKRGLEEGDDAW